MAARFLFLPIEESSYFYFAQMINRTVSIEKQPPSEVEQVAGVLRRLLRALTLLGAIIVVFGFSYSHLLLHLYGTYFYNSITHEHIIVSVRRNHLFP